MREDDGDLRFLERERTLMMLMLRSTNDPDEQKDIKETIDWLEEKMMKVIPEEMY